MNLVELAKDYLRRSRVRVESASRAISSGDYPDAIRFSQEAVEMSLKAALRAAGIEYPKQHDVGPVLSDVIDRFPKWFRVEVEDLARTSAELSGMRAASMYGLELAGRPPSELFDREDAEDALRKAERVYALVSRLLEAPPEGG